MAVLALAGGLIGAPLMTPGTASAYPCDGTDCVPYVARDAVLGAPCVLTMTRYVFGLDASGNTLTCSLQGAWEQSPPLVGVRTLRAPCDESTGVAQSPDGLPMSCIAGGWTLDFNRVYY